jgi:tetratricopeptide (TPR) repeat protein
LEAVVWDIHLLIKELDQQVEVMEEQPEPAPISYKAKQIKILSIMANPEAEGHDYYIEYEKEQDTMLDAFKQFDRERVFLDMPDPVRSTLEEIREYLKDGHHDVLHISAHGGQNENGEGVLFLEDARGKVKQVTGAELANVLNPCPKVVILSACHSASPEPRLIPAAQALFDEAEQVKAVIGMQRAVSHAAAIDFNTAFFQALCDGERVNEAFEKGKDNIMREEAQRREDMPDWPFQNEHQVPLLLRDNQLSMETFSDERIAAPGRPGSHEFGDAKYLERGFIGRRGILRKIYKEVEDKKGAVVLKGPGGIGKSTLITRAAANLRRKGYDFIVLQDETTVEQILEAISKKAAAAGVKEAEEVYCANVGEKEKLAWFVEHYFKKHRVVLIFDNFEENQDAQRDGAFWHQGLKEFLWFFREVLENKHSILFFSTRYRMPWFESMEIGEFSLVEFRKMQVNRRALKRLDRQSVEMIRQEIGGNPRALDLLDRIAREEFGERAFTLEELKDLIPGLQERLLHRKSMEDNFTPLFLERLVSYLDNSQRRLLNAAAVYRIPVKKEAVMAHSVSIKLEDRRKPVDLSLLEYLRDDDLYYVHRLTAHYLLGKMRKDMRRRYHCRAAEYFDSIVNEKGEKEINDNIEARWHYLQAGEWDRAAEVTFALESYLTLLGFPQQSMELLKEVEEKKLNERNRSKVLHQLGMLYYGFGDYNAALTHYQKSMEIKEKIKEIKGFFESLHNIAAIYQERGDYEAALTQYQKARETFEKNKDKKSVSDSLHQIGMIYQFKGDYDKALTHYQKSMEIRKEIKDKQGVPSSLHQIGRIYQEKGEYDAALAQYQKAREAFEKIGDIKGASLSLHNIGMIYQFKGDYDKALTHYQKANETFEKIQYIKGISENLFQVGIIYQKKGDYNAALTHYQKSMAIREKNEDIVGKARIMTQMGTLFLEQKQFERALELFIQAFLVFAKVGLPDAKKAAGYIARVGQKLPEERFVEILEKFPLTPDLFAKGVGFEKK